MAIEFADLDLGTNGRMRDVDTGERDRLTKDRRAGCAGDYPDLRTADMDAIAMSDRLIGLDIEPDHQVTRVLLAPDQSLAPDEIILLGFQGTLKPMPASKGSVWSSNS